MLTTGFGISKNETGLTVAGITGVDKQGWDYLRVKYEQGKDATELCVRRIGSSSLRVLCDLCGQPFPTPFPKLNSPELGHTFG